MKKVRIAMLLFLFVTVLPQAFFSLVGSHFMSFSLLSAGHDLIVFIKIIGLFHLVFHFIYKNLCRLKRRNVVGGNDKRCVS